MMNWCRARRETAGGSNDMCPEEMLSSEEEIFVTLAGNREEEKNVEIREMTF